ncbi:MAG: T9SS type A sorting domain-containing protein, partial [Bacteroidota bacterium]
GDESGWSVSSAGDVNGDDISDLIIGAPRATPNGRRSGESYVIFGSSTGGFSTGSLDLSALNGSNGFVLNGIDMGDESGWSVSSAGDVNGDGIDDVIIGAPTAIDFPNGVSYTGKSYVVFGNNTGRFSTGRFDLSALNGSSGLIINGIDTLDRIGYSVSSAGDVNGDSISDIIIGAFSVNSNGANSGASYVVFGNSTDLSSSLNLSALNGSNGFVLNGIDAGDISGWSVSSAGDVNKDGISDLIIGAPGASTNGLRAAGESYLIFGKSTSFTSSLDLSDLNGTNGFTLNGIDSLDISGNSVSSAGDINGDGIDDFIIAAPGASLNGRRSGETYVIFGQQVTLTSREDTPFSQSITLYPNPATENEVVLTSDILKDQKAKFQWQDELGRRFDVPMIEQTENSYRFDVSELPSGVYFVYVAAGSQQGVKRILR